MVHPFLICLDVWLLNTRNTEFTPFENGIKDCADELQVSQKRLLTTTASESTKYFNF